jgi:MFS family permease
MLSNAGITDASTQLKINVILSAWQLVCALVGSTLAERLGRKWLASISTILATIFLFMLGAFISFGSILSRTKFYTDSSTGGLTAAYGTSDNTSGVYGTVACIFLFLGAYSFGLTPLTVIYPPEVLNYSMRASGMGVYTIATKICGIFVTWVFPYMFNAIGWKTYIVNASWNILFILFVIFYWVETRNLTLEEVDEKIDGIKHADVPDLETVLREKAGSEDFSPVVTRVTSPLSKSG